MSATEAIHTLAESPAPNEGFAARLRSAREMRNLSKRSLALSAGLAPGTVNGLEDAARNVGTETVQRLASVLRVSPSWLAYGDAPVRRLLNFHVAPGYDPMAFLRHVDAVVRGVGGRLDPAMLYVDPFSAVQYAGLAERAAPVPIESATAFVDSTEPLSVIALGSGLAKEETRLAEILTRGTRLEDDIPVLFLFEISHTLLVAGYTHAVQHGVQTVAIEGDFRNLPSCEHLFVGRGGGPRRKLVTMLGCTLGNLPDELSFLRENLVGCVAGDLLLLDFGLRTKDPKQEAKESWARAQPHASFLVKPLSRVYGESAIRVEKRVVNRCPIAGSYALEVIATVNSRSFMVAQWRRYDSGLLLRALESIGWFSLGSWHFDSTRPNCLVLLQRR